MSSNENVSNENRRRTPENWAKYFEDEWTKERNLLKELLMDPALPADIREKIERRYKNVKELLEEHMKMRGGKKSRKTRNKRSKSRKSRK